MPGGLSLSSAGAVENADDMPARLQCPRRDIGVDFRASESGKPFMDIQYAHA